METGKLIQFLNHCDICLVEIQRFLIHDNKPKEGWGFLCCLNVNAARDYCRSPETILQVRQSFLQKGLPSVADDGGIDFWIAIILVEKMQPHSNANQITETLRDCGFDFMSSCRALSKFFDITAWPPNVLIITKGEDRELENVICWP